MTDAPEEPNGRLRLWKLVRDAIIVGLAVFMLVHETVIEKPRELVLAAALLLLGVPVVIRLDERIRRNGEG
jgi:hypothetical protein